MVTRKKRILIFLLVLAMMAALAIPAFALNNKTNATSEGVSGQEADEAAAPEDTDTAVPYAAVHCEKNGHVGYYICVSSTTSQVGKEYRNCIHDRVGISDYREQYKLSEKYRCNLCKSEYSTTDYYWGNWVCP